MNGNILVIEDNPEMQDLLSVLLVQEGYQLLSATTGNDALALLKHDDSPKLILLDLTLPDMSAEIFLTLMKEKQLAIDVPIIYFSACSTLQQMILPKGVVGVIQKPFQLNELFSMIKKHIQSSDVLIPGLRVDVLGRNLVISDIVN